MRVSKHAMKAENISRTVRSAGVAARRRVAVQRVLDGESVEESWNLVHFMVMSYDAVRRQPIGT